MHPLSRPGSAEQQQAFPAPCFGRKETSQCCRHDWCGSGLLPSTNPEWSCAFNNQRHYARSSPTARVACWALPSRREEEEAGTKGEEWGTGKRAHQPSISASRFLCHGHHPRLYGALGWFLGSPSQRRRALFGHCLAGLAYRRAGNATIKSRNGRGVGGGLSASG